MKPALLYRRLKWRQPRRWNLPQLAEPVATAESTQQETPSASTASAPATEVEETPAVEPAPVAEPATAESTQQETPSASTASAPDVAQPEGKSETDDMEAAKA